MKKFALVFMVICLASVTLLAACSSNNDNGSSSGDDGEVIHLKFWGGVPVEAGPQQAVDNWNAANPDIQVEYVRFVNDEAGNTRLETALLAGGQVDLFINYRMDKLAKRIEAGMVEPLDAFIEADQFDIEENFGESSIVKFDDDVTYYIPAIILNDFVSINKSFLDEAGLPIPEEWTWEEYIEYADKLTKGEGPNKRWGSYTDLLQPKVFEYMDKAVKTHLGTNAFYNEAGLSNFDDPAFKQYLDIMVKMERELKVQPPIAEAKAAKMEGIQMFLAEQVAMHWIGTASLRNIKNTEDYPHDFVTAFAPPPLLFDDSEHIGGGTGYLDFTTINSRSAHKEAAWKFMKWYVTEGNEPLISGGRVPAWKLADQDKVASLVLGENPEELFDVESFKRVVFADVEYISDTKFDKLAEIQSIVEEEGELALIGEQTTEEAVQNMKERADRILGE